ncbi:hypothetical protein FQN57_004515 [Myotisia sp. PD_48]|nr:hypothetical protein FQN57_004515 [Myotisia sp. PD_48]
MAPLIATNGKLVPEFRHLSSPGTVRIQTTRKGTCQHSSIVLVRHGHGPTPSAKGEPAVNTIANITEQLEEMPATPCWKKSRVYGAYDVSKEKRIAQLVAAVTYCVLSGGIVFGYAALKEALVNEGAYRYLCSKDELDRGERVCYEQEIRLNLMFTASAVATNICALPVGAFLDAYGPRIAAMIGSILIMLGSLSFAFVSHLPFDGYFSGYLLLAIGGSFIFLSSFHLSNAFPKHSGLILSILNGVFDFSSVIFLLFRLAHESGMTLRALFLCYLTVPGFIFGCQVFLMPPRSYSTVKELVMHAEDILSEDANETLANQVLGQSVQGGQFRSSSSRYQHLIAKIKNLIDGEPNLKDDASAAPDVGGNVSGESSGEFVLENYVREPLWGILHTESVANQTRSPWFALIAVFTMLQMLRINYFISTIRQQYEYLLSPALAKRLNHLFDYLLPLGGLISIPLVGGILDSFTLPSALCLLVSTATIVGVAGSIPNSYSAGYFNIVFFVLCRPYFYTTISDYCAKIFGFQTFGRVYGLIICISGVFNFLQSPLEILTMTKFRQNPIPVNAILTSAGFVAGAVLVVFLWWKSRRLASSTDLTSGLEINRPDSGNVRHISGLTEVAGDSTTALDDQGLDGENNPLLRNFSRSSENPPYGAIHRDA